MTTTPFLRSTRGGGGARGHRSWPRQLVDSQVWLTYHFDRLLPDEFQIDGNRDFLNVMLPLYLQRGMRIYDVGGGKNPVVSAQLKTELGLTIIGLDIDKAELLGAPPGIYDGTICTDILTYRGRGDADLVICQALLEHVIDTDRALAAISSVLKPGGRALIFVPCRNAVYARLNLLLPEKLKRSLLFGVFPETRRDHGFPAYYNQCTPASFNEMGLRSGLITVSRRLYFSSNYFRFCLPLHALWRLWLLLFRYLAGSEAAETFAAVFQKEACN
jgi:SAM-dependent methyltransferase